MPHHPDDQRHNHLRLIAEQFNPDRRKRQSFGSAPVIPNRGKAARELTEVLDRLQNEAENHPPLPRGIRPHLVFRVPVIQDSSPAQVESVLQKAGITVVGVDAKEAVIAFHDDVHLTEMRQGIQTMASGPVINTKTGKRAKSTVWDALAVINVQGMHGWRSADRIGFALADRIGFNGAMIDPQARYTVDIELWRQGSRQKTRTAVEEVRLVLKSTGDSDDRIHDAFEGDQLCLLRVACSGIALKILVHLPVIAELELPPVPAFDPLVIRDTTVRQFPAVPRPPQEGPRVCTLDTGTTTSHPLLASNIGHAEAILTQQTSPDDAHGHGTMVSGIAVFGDVRACYTAGSFASPVTLFSARVLNERNEFDDESLIITQMEKAIQFFHQSPYDCRVFNLSLGTPSAWLETNKRQSLWAEQLDVLARKLKVLLVVSAGNQHFGWGRTSGDAESALLDYPKYLFHPECGLCDPATAAIPITIGGIATETVPSARRGIQTDSVFRHVAEIGEPTPTTRTGPGLNGAVKPEFVGPGGNSVFRDRQTMDTDPALSVMSLSHKPTERLFAFESATSFAAPYVARQGAIVWHRLVEYLGEDPHPNLVRAVLASAARVPEAARDRIADINGDESVRRAYGYGRIDEDFALFSGDRRVALLEQGSIRIDSFLIYEIFVPMEFQSLRTKRSVTVSLAFDPPVRARRAEYLGVHMWSGLIRGKTLEEIVEAYRAETTEERAAIRNQQRERNGAFALPFRCDLTPGARALETSTLQKSIFEMTRATEYPENWYLVVRADRTWAPSDVVSQDFGVTVTLEADEPQLFALLQQRIRARQQQRLRTS